MKIDELERQLHTAAAEVAVSPLTLEEVRRRAGWERRRVGMASLAALLILAATGLTLLDGKAKPSETRLAAEPPGGARFRLTTVSGKSGDPYLREEFTGVVDLLSGDASGVVTSHLSVPNTDPRTSTLRRIRSGGHEWNELTAEERESVGTELRWYRQTFDSEMIPIGSIDFLHPLDSVASRYHPTLEGDEVIDGSLTRRYLLASKSASALDGERPPVPVTIKSHIWVDASGRLKRASYETTVSVDGQKATATMTLDVLEFVESPRIVPPDPDEVIDDDRFDAELENRAREKCLAEGRTYSLRSSGDSQVADCVETEENPDEARAAERTTTTVGSGAD